MPVHVWRHREPGKGGVLTCPGFSGHGSISRPRPLPPFALNSVCAYDFVFDGCANDIRNQPALPRRRDGRGSGETDADLWALVQAYRRQGISFCLMKHPGRCRRVTQTPSHGR